MALDADGKPWLVHETLNRLAIPLDTPHQPCYLMFAFTRIGHAWCSFLIRRFCPLKKRPCNRIIPISVLRDHSKMREVSHRTEMLRVGFQLIESFTHLVNHGIKRGKSKIRELFFAYSSQMCSTGLSSGL